MAVGDVVNGIAASAILDFQPAAGVEVMITSVGLDGTNNAFLIYNGTLDSVITSANTSTNTGFHTANCTVIIDNTNYLRVPNTAAGGMYTGVTVG